jgi:hypothetical protein
MSNEVNLVKQNCQFCFRTPDFHGTVRIAAGGMDRRLCRSHLRQRLGLPDPASQPGISPSGEKAYSGLLRLSQLMRLLQTMPRTLRSFIERVNGEERTLRIFLSPVRRPSRRLVPPRIYLSSYISIGMF